MQYAAVVALAASLVALWIRRCSWRIEFEIASTVSVALQGAAVLILCPGINDYVSRACHALTGLWNFEDFLAHTLYIGGLASLLSMAMGRLNVTIPQFRALVIQRIVWPMTLFVPIFLAVFVFGNIGSYDEGDMWLADPSTWTLGQRCYWTILTWSAGYLLLQTGYVLRKLRRSNSQRGIATLYLGGIGMSMICTCLLLINPFSQVLAWFGMRVALVLYAFAATWSWRRRIPEKENEPPKVRQL